MIKKCKYCKIKKNISEFSAHSKTGYIYDYCLSCNRWAQIESKYKLTKEDIEALYLDQLGKCKICGNNFKLFNLCIDHCHTSKKVRGLLCRDCNLLLGHSKDNIIILKHAIKYLEENQFEYRNS